MFLEQTKRNNPALVEFAFWAHRRGMVLPDTYLIDVDSVLENAARIKQAADRAGVSLYFMLKQLGRNPELGRRLADMGVGSAVTVDYREALTFIRNGIPLGNVGHLVQPPTAALGTILEARPEIVTTYSIEKADAIGKIAVELGYTQDIMLRVNGTADRIYDGQAGGFRMEQLEDASRRLKKIPGIRVAGVCSFPCFLYNPGRDAIAPTPNAATVVEAARRLTELGHDITQRNMPSASCANAMPAVAAAGGTHAEPGHGLTGTTPWHVKHQAERQAVVYLTEVSHNFDHRGYCFGGGHYRRSHLAHALVGQDAKTARLVSASAPDGDSIDYHFTLEKPCNVGDTVLMAFRTQIFVTRSTVALVEGLQAGTPRIVGVYDAQGARLE